MINLTYSTADFGRSDGPKRHAACDECRQRKMKCSGEPTGCSRCTRLSLPCHYSPQKQMGRPPKRKRIEEDNEPISSLTFDDSSLTGWLAAFENLPDSLEPLEASDLFQSTYKSVVMNQDDLKSSPFAMNQSTFDYDTLQSESNPMKPSSILDYSQMNMFQPPAYQPPSTRLPTAASDHMPIQCSCLSRLYLCLNSISTLSSLPPSTHTLKTLYETARTAKAVIHCPICPQAFSTAMQNLMLLGTVLVVVADAWLLLLHKDPETLGSVCVDPAVIALSPIEPEARRIHWKQWLQTLVKHAIIGKVPSPILDMDVQLLCLESPSLLSLIEDMEERQHKRHAEGCHANNNGWQAHNLSFAPLGSGEEGDHFCLRVVGSARRVLAGFKFDEID